MRLLLLHPCSTIYGGGELVAAWTIQALKDEHSLSILAWEQLHTEEINRTCGTDISPADYRLILPPAAVRRVGQALGGAGLDSHRLHRYGHLMRMARRLLPEHDLAITAFSEADLGGAGIQYVHEPWTAWTTAGRAGLLLRLRYRAWAALYGFSEQRMAANLTLVNSAFTARRVGDELGIAARVLRPPAPGQAQPVAWERREQTAIGLGRLVADKRFEEMIEIVGRVRRAGVDLRLRIAGRPDPGERRYLRRLRAEVARAGPWVTLHENLPRHQLLALLAEARYGLHTFREEPFGIALAEMLRAGCIPFAHRGGGVGEILGSEELLFSSASEAAAGLERVIDSPADQRRLRAELASRAQTFSEREFVRGIREVVDEYARRAGAPNGRPARPGHAHAGGIGLSA